jgi:hypothetical protein
MERVRDLPGDDDDDMGDEEIEELFGHGAVPGEAGAEDPIDLDGDEGGGGEEDGENTDDDQDQVSRPLPPMCGKISRSSSKWVPKVRRSGMALSASIAKSSTLVDLQVALATSVIIGINVLRGEIKLGGLVSLRFLLILMVLCVIGITVLCVLVLNCVDCLLG